MVKCPLIIFQTCKNGYLVRKWLCYQWVVGGSSGYVLLWVTCKIAGHMHDLHNFVTLFFPSFWTGFLPLYSILLLHNIQYSLLKVFLLFVTSSSSFTEALTSLMRVLYHFRFLGNTIVKHQLQHTKYNLPQPAETWLLELAQKPIILWYFIKVNFYSCMLSISLSKF